jgi:hypothetical protein
VAAVPVSSLDLDLCRIRALPRNYAPTYIYHTPLDVKPENRTISIHWLHRANQMVPLRPVAEYMPDVL